MAGAFAVSLGASAQPGEHGATVAEPSAMASMVVLNTATVTTAGESYRVRRAENRRGSLVLVRNHTSAPLAVSLGGNSKLVPAGGAVAQRCAVAPSAYPIVVASEQGDPILNEQARCGDLVTVLTDGRFPPKTLQVVNESRVSPGKLMANPLDRSPEVPN